MLYNAVVLAGSPNNGPLKGVSHENWEALIEVAGRPMVAYVLDALKEAKLVREIVVVGPQELKDEASRAGGRVVPPGSDLVENISRGVRALPKAQKVLVVTSDIPLIAGVMIDEFLDRCSQKDGEFFYSAIPRPAVEARYPGARRTYVRLREGHLTGGNIVVLDPAILDRFHAIAEKIVNDRKNPVALARILGWRFILSLLFGRLDIPSLEHRVSRLFGLRAFAVICWDPEVGLDVDKAPDLELVNAILEETPR